MRRLQGRVVSVVLLLALFSIAPGSEFHSPGHDDGDEGEVGLI